MLLELFLEPPQFPPWGRGVLGAKRAEAPCEAADTITRQ